MNQKYAKYGFSARIIGPAIITLFCSLVACIIHVYEIQDTYLEQHMNSYTQQITVAKTSMDNQINQISTSVEGLAEEIEQLYPNATSEELFDIVNKNKKIGFYSYVIFEDMNNNVYTFSNTPILISGSYDLRETENGQKLQGFLVQESSGDLSTYFSLSKYISTDDTQVGVLKCYFKTTKIFEDSTFDFLTNEGCIYITDLENEIISMSNQSKENLNNDTQFSEVLAKTFGDSKESKAFFS